MGWKRAGHDLATKQQTQQQQHREVMLNRLKCSVEGHYSLKVRGRSTSYHLGKGPNSPLIPAKTILNYIMPAGLRASSPVSLQFFLHTSTRVIFQKIRHFRSISWCLITASMNTLAGIKALQVLSDSRSAISCV